jgi:mRNA-degrading endonuclease toxin of MazEF toxin-antitoxin module
MRRTAVPLTSNLNRADLAGTAIIASSPEGLPADSVALAFQLRAVSKTRLEEKIRSLSDGEIAELEMAVDEALGRVDPIHLRR